MPFDRRDYPPDWERIAVQVKQRAGWRCQWPGCGVEQYERIHRDDRNLERFTICDGGACCRALGVRKAVRIVLTAAHLNHTPADCRPENLRAYCQLHHLRYDAAIHAERANVTRAARRRSQMAEQVDRFRMRSDAARATTGPIDALEPLLSPCSQLPGADDDYSASERQRLASA